jgi:hypothetical protein
MRSSLVHRTARHRSASRGAARHRRRKISNSRSEVDIVASSAVVIIGVSAHRTAVGIILALAIAPSNAQHGTAFVRRR